jgi:transcription-repair coupling factor (superfamily II helicase)
LQDRFGELPTPAAHLLVWLTIKALALAANVSSVITTEDEFIVRLPVMSSQQREQLASSFGKDTAIRTGTQFVRLNRRMAGEAWEEKLITILEVLRGSRAETSKAARRRARR